MAAFAATLLLGLAVTPPRARSTTSLEVVATGVPRPLQLVMDGRALVILSPGWRGDSAGEIYRVDLGGDQPVDLTRQPRVRIPFADARMASLGSLTLDPATGQLFLGEENGTRIYRLSSDERLTLYARGLHRLAGGSTLAFDATGRLVVLDNVDSATAPGEERAPPELEPLGDEDYRGPLVLRFALDPDIPLPRRLDRLPPLFPRAWGGRKGGGLLPRLIAVAASPMGELTFLSSAGEVLRLTSDGSLASLAHLPRGQGMYNRINMVAAPNGDVFVSGGFHVARIFLVSAQGAVATVASNLADPEGIALDGEGRLYIAESSLHRIVRLTLGRP